VTEVTWSNGVDKLDNAALKFVILLTSSELEEWRI